jgi:hypothetical protein
VAGRRCPSRTSPGHTRPATSAVPVPQTAPPALGRRRGPLGRLRVARNAAHRKMYVHPSRADAPPRPCHELLPPRVKENAAARIARPSMPNGAQLSCGRGRTVVESGPTPALWRSASGKGVRVASDSLPAFSRGAEGATVLKYCSHAPLVSFPSVTGRVQEALRWLSTRPAAAFPCSLRLSLLIADLALPHHV